jgi:hypothetical protein
MRRLLIATAACSLFAAPASAAVLNIPIDNFGNAQGPVEDLVLGGGGVSSGVLAYTLGGHSFDREFSVELLAFLAPIQAQAEVALGVFDIVNGTGEKSEVILNYTVPASVEAIRASAIGLVDVALFFRLTAVDLNPITINAELNGNDLGPVIPAVSLPGFYYFNVSPLVPIDGSLKLIFNGDPGYDLTIDDLHWQLTGDSFDVPGPAMLGLFGLGLTGLALARRRKAG